MENKKTIEEAAENYVRNESDATLKLISEYSFKDGAKWQAERMYSEEYIRIMLRELSSDLYEIDPLHSLEDWFEQYNKGQQ